MAIRLAIKKDDIRISGITVVCVCMLLTVMILIFISYSNTATKIHGTDYADFSLSIQADNSQLTLRAFGEEYLIDYSPLVSAVNNGLEKCYSWLPRSLRIGMQFFQMIQDALASQ